MKNRNNTDKHIFAFYTPYIFLALKEEASLTLTDSALAHRLEKVLRMKQAEEIILFNGESAVQAEISFFSRTGVGIVVKQILESIPQKPALTLALPLLKKEALEEAVYNGTELGATVIQLISTHKSRKQLTIKEVDRLHSHIIAAAEQAKNYHIPLLKNPITYQELCALSKKNSQAHILLCADPMGEPLSALLAQSVSAFTQEIVYLIGPEGGLTQEEFAYAQNNGFIPVKLTCTTLRAVQAATLGVGIIRNL